MAKSKTINLINTASELIGIGKKRGVMHLNTLDKQFETGIIHVRNKRLQNFGSCSYMSLELDPRIIKAAQDAIMNFGSQFSCSRAYVSYTLYDELEAYLSQIFGLEVILSTCSTLGHLAVVPIVMEEGDAVILDQQAHVSMQEAVNKMLLRDVKVEMIRHSRLDLLEEKIKELMPFHNRIWYVVDGIYSMYGDCAPLAEIVKLLDKYKSLRLYVDDAHGMSWAGINGRGYTLSKIDLHPKMIFATSLAKGFASAGGVFLVPDKELRNKIKSWGGPLTYSGPQQPAVIGASIEAAKIHLSDEITQRQKVLADKIKYCNNLLKEKNLPVTLPSESPIFYIGLGLVRVGYNMMERLISEGFYVSLGIFPGVPENRTGLRFTLNHNHSYNDIESLVEKIALHIPKALKDENRSGKDIERAFRDMLPSFYSFDKMGEKCHTINDYEVIVCRSITEIHEDIWNSMFEGRGVFDYQGLLFLENVFQNNSEIHHNWEFYYLLIKEKDKIVAATFLTNTIVKEDFFASENISKQVEELRKNNQYLMTSKTLMMGSVLTNGEHLYYEKENKNWKLILMKMLDQIWKIQDEIKAESIYLRDFNAGNTDLENFFIDQGFLKVETLDNHIIENLELVDFTVYLNSLKSNNRRHIKNDSINIEDRFFIKPSAKRNINDIELWYNLYLNVKKKNFEINDFQLPIKVFRNIFLSDRWEIIEIRLKQAGRLDEECSIVAIVCSYLSKKCYCPVIIGLDYSFKELKIYKQSLYQVVKRMTELKYSKMFLGLTASLEKRKLGAKAIPQIAFIQSKDDFNRHLLGTFADINKDLSED